MTHPLDESHRRLLARADTSARTGLAFEVWERPRRRNRMSAVLLALAEFAVLSAFLGLLVTLYVCIAAR